MYCIGKYGSECMDGTVPTVCRRDMDVFRVI